jgi:hypothetical protein
MDREGLYARSRSSFSFMATREEVYSKFGMAAEAAQLLETVLGTALLAIKGLKRGWHVLPEPEQARLALDRIKKSTLGALFKEVQGDIVFEGDLPAFFLSALDTRNRLMHGFYGAVLIRPPCNLLRIKNYDSISACEWGGAGQICYLSRET